MKRFFAVITAIVLLFNALVQFSTAGELPYNVVTDPKSKVRMVDLNRYDVDIIFPIEAGNRVNSDFTLSLNPINGQREKFKSLHSISLGDEKYLLALMTDYSLSFYMYSYDSDSDSESDNLTFYMCSADQYSRFPKHFDIEITGVNSIQLVYYQDILGPLDLQDNGDGLLTITCGGRPYAGVYYWSEGIVIG